MQLHLKNIGKRFNRQWIFKGITHSFAENSATALVGNNGSGKSTLLQVLFNYQTYSKGSIEWVLKQTPLNDETLVGNIAFAAPYLELPEEFTLQEMLDFHFNLVPLSPEIPLPNVLTEVGLAGNEKKYIKHFSSGMKQRLKLILALYSTAPLLLLDEPCTNLDENGINWYKVNMRRIKGKKTIIIASNQAFEYECCDTQLDINSFKPQLI